MTKTIVVTVTYGDRWPLLRRAIASVQRDGASLAVVVDNAAAADIEQLASAEFGSFVRVTRNTRNLGSAGGFNVGLRIALELGADFVLLLDDDNEVQPGCLATLAAQYALWQPRTGNGDLAMLAYRQDHQADVAAGMPGNRMIPRRNAFFGFSVVDVPFKIWRRTAAGGRALQGQQQSDCYVLETAPYSGMFLSRDTLLKHGLPNEQLVLYADDTEFSYRLTAAGGKIVLATGARIVDLDRSWNVKTQFASSFDSWLLGGSDMRVYYAARNHAYWELHCRAGDGMSRTINRAVYLVVLRLRAKWLDRHDRLQLLLAAIRDGEARRLGEHALFKL